MAGQDHPLAAGPAAGATLTLPPLYAYQEALVTHPRRDVAVVSATQIGKSTACAAWLLARLWCHPNARGWWCAPTYWQAENGYNILKTLATSAGVVKGLTRDSKLTFSLINGAVIECRSWERDENLQGPSVHYMVIDEAGLLTPSARGILSSRRSATLGPIRYIGNPTANMTEFWRLVQQAKAADPDDDRAPALMKWTWRDKAESFAPGPDRDAYINFIEDEKKNLPSDEFRRLYEAEFLEIGTGILDFKPVCVNGGDSAHPVRLPWSEPWNHDPDGFEDEPVVGGLDLGQRIDWTVLSLVGRRSGRLKAMLRIKDSSWDLQIEKVIALASQYGRRGAGTTYASSLGTTPNAAIPHRTVMVYFDETGVGGPLEERLTALRKDTPVRFRGVTFNSDNKQEMVQGLQLAIEQRIFSMPWIAEAVSEAETLERTALSTSIRYKAAEGFHDDVVWSLGLAVYGLRNSVTGGLV